jgi:integral membrane protein (TIGR01906 family)
MSQNEQGPSSGKQWWEAEEFDGEGYVPGALNSSAGSAGEAAPESAAQTAPETSGESSAAPRPGRAEREAAAAPATEATPVVAPSDPAPTAIIAPPVALASAATGPATEPLAATSAPASVAPATAAAASAPPTAATTVLRRPARADGATASPAEPSTARDGQAPPSEESLRASLESKPILPRVLQWVVAILTPLVLLALAVRTVASGAFLWLEYHRPGFPSDSFGFSDEQRMVYGSYGLNYINSFAGSDYLGGLVVPDGVRTLGEPALFRPEEVGHMADVQSLVHLLYLLASIAGLIVLVCCLILRARWAGGVRRGLFAGAWVTVGLAGVLGVLGAIGWERFFTGFHELFFSQGNWEFYLDDTLIRLYPPQFWVDAALVLGGLVLIACVLILVLTWPTRARRERSALAQSKRDFRLD